MQVSLDDREKNMLTQLKIPVRNRHHIRHKKEPLKKMKKNQEGRRKYEDGNLLKLLNDLINAAEFHFIFIIHSD